MYFNIALSIVLLFSSQSFGFSFRSTKKNIPEVYEGHVKGGAKMYRRGGVRTAV